MDQYINIHESRDEIMGIIARNIRADTPFQDPVLYSLHKRLERRFARFFENLMYTARAHNFEEENLEDILEAEDLYGFNAD